MSKTPAKGEYASHKKEQESEESGTQDAPGRKGPSFVGKFVIFLGFPLFIGFLGLYFSYLETGKNPDKEISLDRDFILPFLLALAMVVVIGIQTSGYSTEMKPLVAWPKVRRVKKVVRKKKDGTIEPVDVNKKTK